MFRRLTRPAQEANNPGMSWPVTVRVTQVLGASAERVFDAWITPAQASRFLFATRTGNVMQCEIDPRVGGKFFVTDRRPQAEGEDSVIDVVHRGTYVELDRPTRLSFDFSVMHMGDETRVEIRIEPQGPNACELTLTHDLGDDDEARAMQEAARKGWTTMLANMEKQLFPKRIAVS